MTISSVVDRGEVSGQIKVYFALVVNVAIDLEEAEILFSLVLIGGRHWNWDIRISLILITGFYLIICRQNSRCEIGSYPNFWYQISNQCKTSERM